MKPTGEIFVLDGHDAHDVEAIADLHVEHLSDSPIVAFGDPFLRRFFYTTLVREGLVVVSACRSDGKVVGFASYTTEPLGFMKKAILRHPFQLTWVMFLGFLQRPAMIREVFAFLRSLRDRADDDRGGIPADRGEVISVVAEPTAQKLVPEGGKERLTPRLFKEMMTYFEAHRCGSFHLLVKPENRASNIFCAAMGCRFEKITHGGVVTHRYVYEFETG